MKHKQMLELMGKLVTYTQTWVGTLDSPAGNKVTWVPQSGPLTTGWVVGFRKRYNGIRHKGCYLDPEEPLPPWFEPTTAVDVVLVSRWPTCRPAEVYLPSIVLGGQPRSPHAVVVDRRLHDELSQAAREQQRDIRGRFVRRNDETVG